MTLNIDGVETVRNFGYDVHLIGLGDVVYLGGSDNTTSTQQFRGIVTKVGTQLYTDGWLCILWPRL